MESLIFVSGFENTGTRLIPMILEKCGYETFYKKKTNGSYDYLKGFFHTRFFKRYYFNKDNFNYFKKTLNNDIKNVKKCIIKHGPICFMIDDLKKTYPYAKFIHCIRKPEDTLVKKSFYYKEYGLYDTFLGKVVHEGKLFACFKVNICLSVDRVLLFLQHSSNFIVRNAYLKYISFFSLLKSIYFKYLDFNTR